MGTVIKCSGKCSGITACSNQVCVCVCVCVCVGVCVVRVRACMCMLCGDTVSK